MRLLFKLSQTVFILVMTGLVLYLLLPQLLGVVLRYQLLQQGFDVEEIDMGKVTMYGSEIDTLRLSNDDISLDIQDLHALYEPSVLLRGSLSSMQIANIRAVSREAKQKSSGKLPDPALLKGIVALVRPDSLPFEQLRIKHFSYAQFDGSRLFEGWGGLERKKTNLFADFTIVDASDRSYQLLLDRDAGGQGMLSLFAEEGGRTPALWLRIHSDEQGEQQQGLSAMLGAELSQFGTLLGYQQALDGQITAEIAYLPGVDASTKQLQILAESDHLVFGELQLRRSNALLEASLQDQSSGLRFEFSPASEISFKGLMIGSNSVAKGRLVPPRQLLFNERGVQFLDKQAASVSLDQLTFDEMHLPHVDVSNISYPPRASDERDRCSVKFQLNIPTLEIGQMGMGLEPISALIGCPQAEKDSWRIRASIPELSYGNKLLGFLLYQCELIFDYDASIEQGQKLNGKFDCASSSVSGEVSTDIVMDVSAGAGSADYEVAGIEPGDNRPLFRTLFKTWDQPLDIVTGNLAVKGRYSWPGNDDASGREKLTAEVQANDIGGYYDTLLFSGLDYADTLQLLPTIESAQYAPITVEGLDIGLPIEGISASIRYATPPQGEWPLISIRDLSVPMFGGLISGDELIIDLNSDVHVIRLTVTGLDLEQIIALQQLTGLEASGLLDGDVPVTISPAGIRIDNGLIYAQEQGGRIRYQPEGERKNDIEESVPGSELVLRILEDLNYDILNIKLAYREDGEMEMNLEIKGMSPQVDTRRPVHFNLNLEQNLHSLLRQLRYTQGISEQIDQNVKKHFGTHAELR